MAEIQDVAYYILQKLDAEGNTEGDTEPISTQKLQLLTYYCYVWSLVWTPQQPLCDASFEAWANGPISPELHEHLKGLLTVTVDDFTNSVDASASADELDTDELDTDAKETIDVVLDAYAHLNGQELSDIAHAQQPWKQTYRHDKHVQITNADMYKYYNHMYTTEQKKKEQEKK